MDCPLCRCTDVVQEEEIERKDLIGLYLKYLKYDISTLVTNNLYLYRCKDCTLRFYSPPVLGDESFYNVLQMQKWYYMSEKAEFFFAKKYITDAEDVLEVGSGRGAFAKIIKPKSYTGLDQSLQAKELAKKDSIFIENKTIEAFADENENGFDVVVSFQVLEHVSDPASFIQNQLRALKVGGKLIVSVPCENSFLNCAVNSFLNMPPHHITRWQKQTLEYLPKIFAVSLVDIYHEPLQSIHKAVYLETLLQNAFLKYRSVDLGFVRRVHSKLCGVASRFLCRGLSYNMLPKGHTITAVYKKNA